MYNHMYYAMQGDVAHGVSETMLKPSKSRQLTASEPASQLLNGSQATSRTQMESRHGSSTFSEGMQLLPRQEYLGLVAL